MLNKEKIISNFDLSLVDEEQLFTELTSEEAAVIEGGLTLHLQSIKAIRVGADSGSRFSWQRKKDEAYLRVNQRTVWGVKKMKRGQESSIQKLVNIGESAVIQLFDQDRYNRDDPMGLLYINQRGNFRRYMQGSGSLYALTFRVI